MQRYHIGLLLTSISLITAYLIAFPGMRTCLLNTKEGILGVQDIIRYTPSCISSALIAAAILGIFGAALLILDRKELEKLVLRHPLASVIAIALAFNIPYLGPGHVGLGDALEYYALTAFLRDALLAGTFPLWTSAWYMGSLPFAFYGWLYFLLAAILSLATGIDWSQKILFILLHLTSVLGAYGYILTVSKRKRAAIIGALAYGLSFQHFATIFIGRNFVSLLYALTPLLFLLFEKRMKKAVRVDYAITLTSLLAAALLFTHQADGFFILSTYALYVLLRITRERALKIGLEQLMSGALTIILTAWWIIPMILEQSSASGSSRVRDILLPHNPLPDMLTAIQWPGLLEQNLVFYLGLSILTLALLGTAYLIRRRAYDLYVPVLMSSVLFFVQSARYAPASLLLLGLAAGHALRRNTGTILIIALIILDMAPATAQLGYPDLSYSYAFYQETITHNDRVLDLSSDRRLFWPSDVYISRSAESVHGTIIQTASHSYPYAVAASQVAAIEYYDQQQNISSKTKNLLSLFGVNKIVLHNEQRGIPPQEYSLTKRGALGLERNLSVIAVHTPQLIATSNLQPLNQTLALDGLEGWNLRAPYEERDVPTEQFETLVDEMKLENGTARFLYVRGPSENVDGGSIESYTIQTRPTSAAITLTTTGNTFVHLPYTYNRQLLITNKGEPLTVRESAWHTTIVELPAGEHHLTIQYQQSTLRVISSIVSLLGIIAIGSILIIGRKLHPKNEKLTHHPKRSERRNF